MSLASVRIAIKLPTIMIALCFATAIAISSLAYSQSKATMLEQTHERLDVLVELRVDQLEKWSQSLLDDISGFGQDPSVVDAVIGLSNTYGLIGDNPTDVLHDAYITNNPYEAGERDKLEKADIPHPYHFQHERFHSFFRAMKETDSYYDVFLFNGEGDLVYSVYKEADFATNFLDGPYQDSGLAQAYSGALAAAPGSVVAEDFAPYAPSYGQAAAFIATPVVNEFNETIGVFAIQLPLGLMTSIVGNPLGLGLTGDARLVGNDGNARTTSRFEGYAGMLEPLASVDSLAQLTKNAQFAVGEIGWSGNPVLVDAKLINVLGFNWALMAEIDESEVLSNAKSLRNMMLVSSGIILVVVSVIGFFVARTVTGPLTRIDIAMNSVANRKADVKVPDISRGDEIGAIAKTLVAFRDKLEKSESLEAAATKGHEDQRSVVKELGLALNRLSEGDLTTKIEAAFPESYESLRNDYNASMDKLAEAISVLLLNTRKIRSKADTMAEGSAQLSQRTENQAATLEETAAALDEMTRSVKLAADDAKEIEKIVGDANDDASQSSPVVGRAVAAMKDIKESSKAISKIIGVIDDISFQTNLLALNAGIEAARAGDAGKGFAVVASEVQALAQRSSTAANEIKELIDGSADKVDNGEVLVGQAGEALQRIVGRISHITDLMGGIASRSEEQSTGLGEINIGVSQLDQVTQKNAAMVDESIENGQSMLAGAQALSDAIGNFRLPMSAPSDVQPVGELVILPDANETPYEIDDAEQIELKIAVNGTVTSPQQTYSVDEWKDF